MYHKESQRLSNTKKFPRQSQFLMACFICLILLTLAQPVSVFASPQIIGGDANDGNLRIQVTDTGQMGVERYVAGSGWVSQIFSNSPGSKGSKLYANGSEIMLGYFDGTQATNVGNTISGNTITTSWTSGSIGITQKTTYTNGNAYYRLEWTISNNGGSVLNDLRFYHGEDTYLLGGDNGAGFWDAANNSIGVKKPDAQNVEQRMTLQGVTIPYAYDSLSYSTSLQHANENGLTNTLDTTVSTDNGYALEWRTASLAPGANWTIIAFEKFNNAAATGLSVTAPVSIDCDAGATCNMSFSVQNVGTSTASVNLWLSGGPSWGETITSPSVPVNIAANETQTVVVQVSVPAGTAGGTTANITLNASDGTNTSSDTGGVYIPVPPYIAPTAFTSSTPAGGVYGVTYSHDFNANGTPDPTYSISSGRLPDGFSLNPSTGVLTGTPTAAGAYTFTVMATNPGGSTSQSYSININQASTALTVTSDNNDPSRYGEYYTVRFHVASTNSPAVPNGIVSVSDGANPICSGTLDSSGNGSCNLRSTFVTNPTVNLTATYAGNSNFLGSSANELHTIIKADTKLGISSSNLDAVYGEVLTYTATASTVEPGAGTPVGTVQFYINSSAYGSPVTLNDSGTASINLPYNYFTVGSHSVRAAYSGNQNFNGSNSTTPTQDVHPAPTSLSVTSSQNPTVYGTSIIINMAATANDPSLAIPTGTVQLSIDGVPFGSALTLDENGEASRTIPYLNLWPDHHDITAIYTPSTPAQFVSSSNLLSPVDQLVNKANPIFTITPSADSAVASQPVSYQVLVAPSMPTQGIPTGTIQFFVDGTPLGDAVALDAEGKANSPLSIELPAGIHQLTVSYSGDDYFLSVPTSAEVAQTIEKASVTARILSIDPSASVVGQPVTVSVQVDSLSPATDAPNGSVTVSNGLDTCLATLDSTGSGSCSLEPTAPGSPDLIASYPGSANFNGASSDPFAGPVVSKADSSVGVTGFSPTTPVTGQPVTINFSVSPLAPGWGTPTGMVTISDQLDRSCSASVSAGSCQIIFDQAGPTGLTAAYAGDDNFNSSSSSTAIAGPVVAKASTSLVLVSSDDHSIFGQPVHFTAAVSVSAPGAGDPTGQVQFTIDGNAFGNPVDLSSGSAASPDIADLSVANHTIGATYLGDADFSSASAPSIDQVVDKADTTLVLDSNLNPAPYGTSVLITASLSGNDPSIAIPGSGTVQFIVDGVNYGAPIPLNASGQASKLLPYTALWVGQHDITAIYSGNDSFNGSNNSASPLLQVIEKGILSITLEPTVSDPVFGQPVSFSATIAGGGANTPVPTGTVQFGVDGINLGSTVALDAEGSALSPVSIATLSVGAHTLNLTYSGDDYYRPTTFEVPSGVVVARASVSLTSDSYAPTTAVVGEPIAFSFNVLAAAPGAGTPTGSVTVTYAGASCTADVTDASCNLAPYSISPADAPLVTYSGDDNFLPDEISLENGPTITAASVTVAITGTSSAPVVTGQPYTITAQVSPLAPSTLIPTGQPVTISNGVDSCSANVQSDGSVSCDITPTSAGPQSLSAAFGGGENFLDASSDPFDGILITPADTAITLVSSINPVVEGAAVHFTASVQTAFPGSGVPSGMVQFKIDDENYGSPVNMVNGTATSPDTSEMALGSHAVTAVYQGNSNYNTSTSATLSQRTVVGDLSSVSTPSTDGDMTFNGVQNGLPVTTRIHIPAGAVDENVTLIFHQFNNSLLTPPTGKNFVANFTIDVYVDGVLQPDYEFLQPVTFSMEYNPEGWIESNMSVLGWNGGQWSSNGITMTGINQDTHTITFTLAGSGANEFALTGETLHILWMSIILK